MCTDAGRRALRGVVLLAALGLPLPLAAQGQWPQLQPLEQVLAPTGGGRLTAEGAEALSERAARLSARARGLRAVQPVDGALRARIAAVAALRAGG